MIEAQQVQERARHLSPTSALAFSWTQGDSGFGIHATALSTVHGKANLFHDLFNGLPKATDRTQIEA